VANAPVIEVLKRGLSNVQTMDDLALGGLTNPWTHPVPAAYDLEAFFWGQADRSPGVKATRTDTIGALVWGCTMPQPGEFGDATMLANGNIVFSRYGGASEVTPNHDIVWNFDAPAGTEIHTCQPLSEHHVFLMLNAVPASAVIIDMRDNSVCRRLTIPTAGTNTHMMFRHCRYTGAGTFLIAHMDSDRVTEYDADGAELWSVEVFEPWAAVRLANGNTLISGNRHGYVREVSPAGEVAWEFDRTDAQAVGLTPHTIQRTQRLANGNTVVADWNAGPGSAAPGSSASPGDIAQLFEVTPDKRFVWLLAEWSSPKSGACQRLPAAGSR